LTAPRRAPADFAASFNDIARVNRFLGGTRAVLDALTPMLRALPAEHRTVRILDIATGSADIPRAIVRAARRGRFGSGRRVEIVATDNHPTVLALARRAVDPSYPEITIEPADAFSLPYPDGSFDVALCSMAFHHWGPAGAARVLREMDRITSVGLVVNDLVRHRLARALIACLSRLARMNRLTQHDAPLSVLKAFTIPEYAQIVRMRVYPARLCAASRYFGP
jgi:ubiquinone/menaquinone biosynthesis C-methylase UbiE